MQEFITSSSKIFPAIFVVLEFFLASYFIGEICFPSFQFRRSLVKFIVFTILGIDILSFLAIILGAKFDKFFPFFLLILLSFVFLTQNLRFRDFNKILRNKSLNFFNYTFDFSYLFLFIIILLLLGRSLCPPTSWDELVYQLSVPQRWILTNSNVVFPDNPYSAFPSLSGVIFRVLISNSSFIAPRLFVLFLFLLTYLSLSMILSPLCGKKLKIILLIAFSLSFPTLMISSSAYSDIFIVANFAAAILILQDIKWITRNKMFFSAIFLIGILAGAALSVKLTGFIIIIGIIILLFRIEWSFSRNFLNILLFIIVSSIFSSIFYLRPYVYTGNPFYPYFGWIFSSDSALIEMSRYHHAIAVEKYGINNLSGLFFSPFFISLGIGNFDGTIGLQFFVLIFFAFLSFWLLLQRKISSFYFKFLIIFLIFHCFWFFSSQQARFYVPAIFALCISSSYFISRLYERRKIIYFFIIVLSLISVPRIFVKDIFISWKTVLGRIRKIDYIYSATGPGYLKVCDIIASNKDFEGKKFLLLFENRGLYLKCSYEIATPFFQEKYFTPPENFDEKKVLSMLKKEKISYIIVGLTNYDPDRLQCYLERANKIAEIVGQLIGKKYLTKIWEEEGYAIFKINDNF